MQYKILSGPGIDINNPLYLPKDENLTAEFSIFVKYKPTSVEILSEDENISKPKIQNLHDKIIISELNLLNNIEQIVVYNSIGNLMFTTNVKTNSCVINTMNFSSGVYNIVCIGSNSKVYSTTICLMK